MAPPDDGVAQQVDAVVLAGAEPLTSACTVSRASFVFFPSIPDLKSKKRFSSIPDPDPGSRIPDPTTTPKEEEGGKFVFSCHFF
jgi:hypothetical protein